jgi:hypothetical protein
MLELGGLVVLDPADGPVPLRAPLGQSETAGQKEDRYRRV